MNVAYDGLDWDVNEIPVGFSTPDDLFEYWYRATTHCNNCGNEISGTAYYWSREESGDHSWLNNIMYTQCGCGSNEENDDDDFIE